MERKKNPDLTDQRNIIVYNGKIAADVETVRAFSEFSLKRTHITKWKKEFQERYDIAYEDIAIKIHDGPDAPDDLTI